jgi:hypothetical protein
VDLGAQFCERCGRDSDSFASAHVSLHACPGCGVTCCSDCWNLVDGACLKCAPFRLVETPRREGTVLAAGSAAGGARMADLHASRMTASMPARATATASRRARPGRRAGRIGIAAAGAWVIVAAMAVVTFGAVPGRPGAPGQGPPAASPAANALTSDGSGRAVPSATPAQEGPRLRSTPRPAAGGSSAAAPGASGVRTPNARLGIPAAPVAGGIGSRTPGSLAGTRVGPSNGTGGPPSATPPPGPVWVPPPTDSPTRTPEPTDPEVTPPGGG